MENGCITETTHFSGRVQGVGFRYTALQTAREFAVTGEVRNLADGRVRLVVTGQASEVKAYHQELSRRMDSYIKEAETQRSMAPVQFKDFSITH